MRRILKEVTPTYQDPVLNDLKHLSAMQSHFALRPQRQQNCQSMMLETVREEHDDQTRNQFE